MIEPYAKGDRWSLYLGDSLAILPTLPPVDNITTDPPYSSGGAMRGDRTGQASAKYLSSDSKQADYLPQFAGDNKDQRGYLMWSALWMGAALDIAKPGCVLSCFTDWRQWTPTTDAMQAGGWIWRGAVPWLKVNARPQRGRFSAAAEYVVWGSAGPMADDGPCHAGHFTADSPRNREHITQKPLDLVRMLVAIAPPDGLVLDPFCGSGTTGVAALLDGRRFIGIERTKEYADIAARRLSEASGGMSHGKGGQLGLIG